MSAQCTFCGNTDFSKIEGKHALKTLVQQGGENYVDESKLLPLRAEMCNSCKRVDFFVAK